MKAINKNMEEELIATRKSYGEALLELGRENENVVVLDADLSNATKTSLFAKEFPKRFFETVSMNGKLKPEIAQELINKFISKNEELMNREV